MSERAYTVSEIDEMRKHVRRLIEGPILNWHVSQDGGAQSMGGRSYNPRDRDAQVEDRLRTYMLNGTTVEELREAVRQQDEATRAALERAQEAAKAPTP